MRISLFVTCLGDQFFSEAARDATRLLRTLGVEVVFNTSQTCCGQPAFNAGHRRAARRLAAHTVRVLRGSEYVVLPSGSCAGMLRRHVPELVEDSAELREEAVRLAGRTFELSQFLVDVLGVRSLGSGLTGRRIAYHHGCHALRELGVRDQPLELLRNSGAEVASWEFSEECCGFGGIFSVKFPEVSAAMADRKVDTLPEVDCLTSADGGCLLQLSGRLRSRGMNLRTRHLAELLWEALDADL